MKNTVIETTGRKMLFRWAGWFSLFNFLLILVLIGRYLKYTNGVEGPLQYFYVFTALLGHVSSLVLLPFLLIFLPVIILYPKPRLLEITGVVAATLGCVIILIDFGVYSQYRFHLNGMVLDFIVNGGTEIFDLSWYTYAFGTIAIIGVFILQIVFAILSRKLSVKTFQVKFRNKLIFLIVLLIFSSNLIHAWADAAYYRPITTMTRHLPLYRPITAKRFMAKHGFVNLDENWKLNKLSDRKMKNSSINYPLSELKFGENAKSMNIVFIVIDSWRFDMLNDSVTPNIASFVKDNPVMDFKNHTSGGCGTRTGIFSMFYGLFGSYWISMETEQIGPVFIDELINRDYQMGIFASAKLTSPAFNQTVFNSVEDLRLNSDGENGWERDIDIVNDWDDWFSKRGGDKPFFSFLFFDAAHAYTFPPDYERPFSPMLERVDFHKLNNDYDPLPFFNRYKTSLHFIDSLIGNVIKRLTIEKVLDNTVIVITSDHGQEFNDNKKNYWGHGSNFTKYQIKVPLVIYWPGKDERTFSQLTNHVDLAPTFLSDLFQCQNPILDYSNGRSLFNKNERQWMFSGGGLSTQAIVEPDRITELFNTGGYEIFTPDYSVMKGAKLNPLVVKESIMEKTRFFK